MPRSLSKTAAWRQERDDRHRAAVAAHHRRVIESAARGVPYGTLCEWVELRLALRANGFDAPLDTPASKLTELCAAILAAPQTSEV